MVADLLRWFSDQNLDWFKADRQRTRRGYMEIFSSLSIHRAAAPSHCSTYIYFHLSQFS